LMLPKLNSSTFLSTSKARSINSCSFSFSGVAA